MAKTGFQIDALKSDLLRVYQTSIWKSSWVNFGFLFIRMRFVNGWRSEVCCTAARARAWSADSSSPITVIVGLLETGLNVRTIDRNEDYRPHWKRLWAQALIHKKPICSKKLDSLNLIKSTKISWDLFQGVDWCDMIHAVRIIFLTMITLTLSLKLRNPNIRCLDRTIAIAEFDVIESGMALVEISAVGLPPPCDGKEIPVADGGRR